MTTRFTVCASKVVGWNIGSYRIARCVTVRFLVPGTMLCGEFRYIIHKHITQSAAAQNSPRAQTHSLEWNQHRGRCLRPNQQHTLGKTQIL